MVCNKTLQNLCGMQQYGFISAYASGKIGLVILLILAELAHIFEDWLAASWSSMALAGGTG